MIDLDTAEHGVLSGPATGLVGGDRRRAASGAGRAWTSSPAEPYVLDTEVPTGLETVELAADGFRALLSTGTTAARRRRGERRDDLRDSSASQAAAGRAELGRDRT